MADIARLALPIRTAKIELDGDYAGLWVEGWLNPPSHLLTQLADPEQTKQRQALGQLIRATNIGDADGNPIDFTDTDVWNSVLPWDLAADIVRGYDAAFQARTNPPKNSESPSANTS